MQSSVQIKKQMRDLANKALVICEDETKSLSLRRQQLDPMDKKLYALEDELKDALFVEEQARSLGVRGWADINPAPTDSLRSKSIGGAPFDLARDEMKHLFDSARAGESVTVKAAPMTTATTDAATAPRSVFPPVGIRREPTRLLDRLPVTATDAAVNRYYVTTASGAGAGVTAEGAQKPESDLTFTKQDAVAAKIAVWA